MIKVIGLGNPLFGDDAFGLHVVEEIKKRDINLKNTEIISLPSPSPWDIYEALREGDFFIIIDAMEDGLEGKIEQFSLDEVASVKNTFKTVHDLNINQVLDLLRINGKEMKGIVVATKGYNFNLSLTLSEKLKLLVSDTANKVIRIIEGLNL